MILTYEDGFTAGWYYTAGTITHHGCYLMPEFFNAIEQGAWPGQFNADFLGFLALSGLWLAWRHHFSPIGLASGVLGLFGGTPVLATYLLVASILAQGDMRVLLLGPGQHPNRPRTVGYTDA